MSLPVLTLANATVYLVAAILHWGARSPLGVVVLAFPQPIRPATIVEAAIGVALATGAVALLARSGSASAIAWAASSSPWSAPYSG